MAQGYRPDEVFNAREVYADIIDLPGWEPGPKHPRMPLIKRAAQFAPYAALTGYKEMLEESLRETEREKELSEEQAAILAKKLSLVREALSAGNRPELTLTYFEPDPRKEGGKYVTLTAVIRRLDPVARKLFLLPAGDADENPCPEEIRIDRLYALNGPLVDWVDD